MTDARAFTIKIVSNLAGRSRGFRWIIFEGQRERDRSTYPFLTKADAEADAEAYVSKLKATWEGR